MKIQLLPSTFDSDGRSTPAQRLTCYVIDDCVALDAGSLAFAASDLQRKHVRDVIVTHPHMDHIASLPIFIDDLFESLHEPLRVYATSEVIDLLERDVFNWTVYPHFAELENKYGRVMEYVEIRTGEPFKVRHLTITAVEVNHVVPTIGMVISDNDVTLAFSSDTFETEEFWRLVNRTERIDALFIESSFPNDMKELAEVSRHFTPASMAQELKKLTHEGMDVMVVHIKPSYRERVITELSAMTIPNLRVMEPGLVYEWQRDGDNPARS